MNKYTLKMNARGGLIPDFMQLNVNLFSFYVCSNNMPRLVKWISSVSIQQKIAINIKSCKAWHQTWLLLETAVDYKNYCIEK